MQDTIAKKKSSAKPYLILGLVVLCALAGWSAFWIFSKDKLASTLDKITSQQAHGQALVSCDDREIGGFPFRLLVECTTFALRDPNQQWYIEGADVKAVWQVYAPDLAVIETDKPFAISHQATGQAMQIESNLLRGSIRFTSKAQIERVSVEVTQPRFKSNNPQLAQSLAALTAEKLELHARPSPKSSSDLELAINCEETSIAKSPQISGSFGFTAKDALKPEILSNGNPAKSWLTQSGQMTDIHSNIKAGQKTLRLSGNTQILQNGKMNGDLALKILNPKPEDIIKSQVLTAKQHGLNGPLTAMQLLGSPISEDNLVGSKVTITIRDSQITAGLLPIGTIPAIR